jgi:hypothetical protein
MKRKLSARRANLLSSSKGEQMRIANYEIERKIVALDSFTNYNATIHAVHSGNRYSIVHWNTVILEYNTNTNTIDFLASGYISQTTSALVGRILRSLPRGSVEAYLAALPPSHTKKRLTRMLHIRSVRY